MALTTDEQAVRDALQEMAGGQPDAPEDRLDGVRRRHHRRRTAQSAGAALGIVALVGGGLAVASALRTTHRQPVPATPAQSWQLSWPERSDGTVSKQAVLNWVQEQTGDQLGHVRWLYDATAPDTVTKWAILEADYPSDPAPIRAQGLFTAVSHDGGDTWSVQTHDAPPVITAVIGVADHNGRDVLALAAPRVAAVQLVNVHREDAVDTKTFPKLVNGATVLTSPSAWKADSVFVRLDSAPLMSPVLFDDDAQAQGSAPWVNFEAPRVPGEHHFGTMSGGGGGGFTQRVDYTGTLVFRVRCASPTPLRLTVTTPGGQEQIDVTRCDGLFHPSTGPSIRRGQQVHTDVGGDQGETIAVISVSVRS